MKKDILTSIENIEIYPIISLLIFVIFFVGMFIWVIRADKNYISRMKDLPFDEEHQKKQQL
ncbi:cbb3-type cytochrome c oxidase subunit 3 [Arthrospiribacter ruber]|uniref:Cbb3-type cytochrome c oxidase subunit 3 n=1 Tax=Arthrospiribacter ruber TaxID=2487934 RepID=A0A951J0F6_9BACT|nr:cbb3-type cytochrome c oxidase subunit 3 [Arthrospiribacter ruber]MBW3468923.1 cbb3-type cytochrome c oxidase subunit 3 [Arthrospiribacter ruber]